MVPMAVPSHQPALAALNRFELPINSGNCSKFMNVGVEISDCELLQKLAFSLNFL